MILAHPDSDLRKNLMVVGTDIVKILSSKKRKENFVLVEDVMEEFLQASDHRTPDMFLNSLSFLFAMGLIERNEYKIKLCIKRKNLPVQKTLF